MIGSRRGCAKAATTGLAVLVSAVLTTLGVTALGTPSAHATDVAPAAVQWSGDSGTSVMAYQQGSNVYFTSSPGGSSWYPPQLVAANAGSPSVVSTTTANVVILSEGESLWAATQPFGTSGWSWTRLASADFAHGAAVTAVEVYQNGAWGTWLVAAALGVSGNGRFIEYFALPPHWNQWESEDLGGLPVSPPSITFGGGDVRMAWASAGGQVVYASLSLLGSGGFALENVGGQGQISGQPSIRWNSADGYADIAYCGTDGSVNVATGGNGSWGWWPQAAGPDSCSGSPGLAETVGGPINGPAVVYTGTDGSLNYTYVNEGRTCPIFSSCSAWVHEQVSGPHTVHPDPTVYWAGQTLFVAASPLNGNGADYWQQAAGTTPWNPVPVP